MNSLYPVLILLLLGFILWMRDEMKESPKKRDDKFPLPKPEDKEGIADEIRNLPDMSLPPGVSMPDKDYTKDEEFCKKHPCDFMKPHRLLNGKSTYLCTNEEAWERWGVKEKVLESLNEGCLEQCARCAGLPCLGQRKENKK